MKKFAISFCLILLFSMFGLFGLNYNPVQADASLEGDGSVANPYIIKSVEDFSFMSNKVNAGDADYISANYKLTNDLLFTSEMFVSIGNQTYPFQGTFDGGGNSIKNAICNVHGNASLSYGIFNYIQNATIKNLSVEIVFNFIGQSTDNSQINMGGIVGVSLAGSEITNCKTITKLYTINENDEKTTANIYSSVNFGGIIGQSDGTSIHDCFSLVEFDCVQYGNFLTESYFGGIVGKINGGEIYNVYAAPTDSTISSLTGVIADKANMTLKNSENAIVYFGGIAGSVSGRNFSLTNTLFIGYLDVKNSPVKYGGIIGKMHASAASRPVSANITQSKYLRINNANTVSFDLPIANEADVAFTVHSTLVQITTMPNNRTYFEDASNCWNNLRMWDFEDVWKTTTIFNASGIFLPDLQQFSELSFYLDYQNYSTYYSLNFEGETADVTSKKFKIGDTVVIEGNFKSTETMNYANFYNFDSWKKVGDENFESDGKIKLTLTCTNQTAGSYYLTISGKTVRVDVNIVNESGNAGAYGSVKQGDNVKVENFSFNAKYADDASAIRLEAIDTLEEYKFSHFASGENFTSQNRTISFKLDNNRANLPPVIVLDGQLVCTINAVFTNNTSKLNINMTEGGGTLKIDEGQAESGNLEKILVNGKSYALTATAAEGYTFDGWYVNGEKVESENVYTITIRENKNLEVRFTKAEEGKNGVNIWVIIGPILGALVLGGIIALIVVKVKKNGANSYKKNYRY